jgi:hypothetical protein
MEAHGRDANAVARRARRLKYFFMYKFRAPSSTLLLIFKPLHAPRFH